MRLQEIGTWLAIHIDRLTEEPKRRDVKIGRELIGLQRVADAPAEDGQAAAVRLLEKKLEIDVEEGDELVAALVAAAGDCRSSAKLRDFVQAAWRRGDAERAEGNRGRARRYYQLALSFARQRLLTLEWDAFDDVQGTPSAVREANVDLAALHARVYACPKNPDGQVDRCSREWARDEMLHLKASGSGNGAD